MTTYGGFSEYAIEKILDHAMGKASWTMPTSVFVALYIGDPFGAGTELDPLVATGYDRVELEAADWDDATFVSPAGEIENAAEVDYGTAGADWGVVTHFAIFDHLDNMLVADLLDASADIRNGDPVSIPIGQLKVILEQKEQV